MSDAFGWRWDLPGHYLEPAQLAPSPPPPSPPTIVAGDYFGRYFGAHYFASRYWGRSV